MKLNKQKFAEAALSLVDPQGNKIEGVTFTEIKIESSDPAVVEVKDADSDGDADIVGISEGTAQIKVSAVASYTDPVTGDPVVARKDAEPIEVIVSPDPITTKLVVTFGEGKDLPVVEEPPVEGEGGAQV